MSEPELPQLATPPLDARFLRWLGARLPSTEALDACALAVSFSADHESLTWRAATGVPEGVAGARHGGTWTGADTDFEDEGWWATGELGVSDALGATNSDLHSSSCRAVETWAAEVALGVRAIAVCTTDPHLYATLWFELPGDDTVDQMMVGLDLFDGLGLDGPPAEALGPLLRAPGPVVAEVSLSPHGVRAVGLGTCHLTSDLLVEVLAVVHPGWVTSCGETLGVLGADEPTAASVQAVSSGARVVVHVALS